VLVAILLLVIGVIAVILGFPRGLSRLERAERLTQQNFYLYSTLEQVRAIAEFNPTYASSAASLQSIIGTKPGDAWGNPDQDYLLAFDVQLSGSQHTVNIQVSETAGAHPVTVFGSLQF